MLPSNVELRDEVVCIIDHPFVGNVESVSVRLFIPMLLLHVLLDVLHILQLLHLQARLQVSSLVLFLTAHEVE